MSIIAKNLWEQNALRKLTTPAAVDDEIRRCSDGLSSTKNSLVPKPKEWQNKLSFLGKLKVHLGKSLSIVFLLVVCAGCKGLDVSPDTPEKHVEEYHRTNTCAATMRQP